MNTKNFKGKAIYNPSGKAGEYSYWACNFYNGCSNDCQYCYCKRGVMSHVWSNKPQLKKCFKDERDALTIFEKELKQNVEEIRKHGLFFSFTTDPMLPETMNLTIQAIDVCMKHDVPVKVLTKMDFTDESRKSTMMQHFFPFMIKEEYKKKIAFFFTLTGHDELEPGASSNGERIAAMKILHNSGFRTGASIEPIIDLPHSINCIERTLGFCDLYKIGLLSGAKSSFSEEELEQFVGRVCYKVSASGAKVYWKDSVKSFLVRDIVSAATVGRDYNMFK